MIREEARVEIEQRLEMHSSGPIPDAETLALYPAEFQERIMRMAEAPTTDESARRDAVIHAGVDEIRSARRWKNIMLLVTFGCAVGTFAWFQNVIFSGLFLSYPVLQIIGSTITTARAQKADED